MSVIHTLSEMDKAIATVRLQKTDAERFDVIQQLLFGQIDYANPTGKMIGTRRAVFCTRLAAEKLWPE